MKALPPEGKACKIKKPISMDFLKIGATGFEPATSASRTPRSTKLSHAPLCDLPAAIAVNIKIINKNGLIVKWKKNNIKNSCDPGI